MNLGLPAALGGTPVRAPGTYPTAPETGELEIETLTNWLSNVPTWDLGCTEIGAPLAPDAVIDDRLAAMLGGEVAAFAAEFTAMQAPGAKAGVIPADNGSRSITVALAALAKVAPKLGLRTPRMGDEVIVPALTWPATAIAVLRRNLVPVLVDVDPNTLCLDVEAVRPAITERTVGIIAVHLYSRMADVDALGRLAEQHNVALGEDCAHAHGASLRAASGERRNALRYAGAIGDWGTFSFFGAKTLGGGEGGAAMSRHALLAEQMASGVHVGRQYERSEQLIAENDRMAPVVAALLRAQLRRFPALNRTRATVFAQLDKLHDELPGITPLPLQPDVVTPPTYKWTFRVQPGAFGPMTLDQVARALSAELGCVVDRVYTPLTDSSLYDPHTDPALQISDDVWQRIDRARYHAPTAQAVYDTVLGIDHSAGLDTNFPDALVPALRKTQATANRLARELPA